MNVSPEGGFRWRVQRGALRVRKVCWEPFSVEGTGSTNSLWKGAGGGREWLLKWYKYPEPGVHPEPEVAEFLDSIHFEGAAGFGARLDRLQNGGWETVAFVQPWVHGVSTWDRTLDALRSGDVSGFSRDLGGGIGGLHAALASGGIGTGFECAAWGSVDLIAWVDRIESGVGALIVELEKGLAQGSVPDADLVRKTLDTGRTLWREKLAGLRSLRVRGFKSRVHGDLHLGQVLERHGFSADGRFCVVDFEGEPMRPLRERRELDLPLRDVAGMWRSLAYAGAVAGAGGGFVEGWRQDFLEGWSERMSLPEGDWGGLLEGLVWEKAVYEALYELRHRPDWLWIPLSVLQKEA